MRKPNPAITQIQVRHRAFTVFEKFRDWLKENQSYALNVVDCAAFNAEHFCQRNCAGLQMRVKDGSFGSPKDMMRIILTGDQQRGLFYSVSFLEYFEDDDGQPAYYSVHVEEFALYDFYKALECLMQRWESLRPWAASNIKQSSHTDFERAYRKVGVSAMHKIHVIMTPKEWQARLMLDPKYLHVVRPDSGFATKLGTTEHPSTEGMVTVFTDGVVMLEDSDVCPSLDQIRSAKVGYTGDKNKHGSGSLDHISW